MRILEGKVLSAKMPNTLIVEIERNRVHPLYKKISRRTKRYKVHYDKAGAKIGDLVSIVEVRPMSKDKHFKLGKVLKTEKITKKSN
jgi:small subunit ribosomal protein S17